MAFHQLAVNIGLIKSQPFGLDTGYSENIHHLQFVPTILSIFLSVHTTWIILPFTKFIFIC